MVYSGDGPVTGVRGLRHPVATAYGRVRRSAEDGSPRSPADWQRIHSAQGTACNLSPEMVSPQDRQRPKWPPSIKVRAWRMASAVSARLSAS